jgi:hypothetical protein
MTSSVEATSRSSPSLPIRGALAVVVSVLANVVLVLGANALGVAPGFQALTVPPVAFLSALGAAGATAVYWALGRFSRAADRTFVRVATAVLVLSFVPDVALLAVDPAATPLGVVVLVVMHVVVAAASVGLLVYWRADE